MARPPVDLRALALFNATYLVAAVIAAFVRQSGEFLFYIVTMLVIGAVVYLVHRRVHLTRGTLWCLSAWGLAHMAGGLLPIPTSWPYNPPNAVLYSLWLIPDLLKYDQIVHAYGFGVCTWICWQGLQAATGVSRPTFGRLSLCALAAVGLGALNEVVEFVATLVFTETNVGGYVNTGWDLVSNLVGAVLAAWLIAARRGGGAPAAAPLPDDPARRGSAPERR
jgi:hypothetical protein